MNIFVSIGKIIWILLAQLRKKSYLCIKDAKTDISITFFGITEAKNLPSARVSFSWLGTQNTNQGKGFKEKEKVLHP